jgi:hypothetical protein
MRNHQHEIPTHLNVEDKLLFGLTMRQFLYVLVGGSIAYALWDQAADLPASLHVALPVLSLLVALALALVRPFGRALEEWLLAGALYVATPRCSSWRLPEPDPANWRPARAAWQDLAPSPVWADGEADS